MKLRARKPSANFNWYEVDKRNARELALPFLLKMTQRHCSYCDGYPVPGTSRPTIDHFRPKSKFHSLSHSWTNLYVCCDVCQTCKGEKWSKDLLAPDDKDYEFLKYFQCNMTTGEIEPNEHASKISQRKARETIELLGLNDEGRPRHRREYLNHWRAQNGTMPIDTHPFRDFLEAASCA